MKTLCQKTIYLLCIVMVMTSCAKDEEKDKRTDGECWYKITIDGQTTRTNQFGEDHLSFTSATGPDGDSGFVLDLIQTKSNGQTYLVFDLSSSHSELFNSNTAVGTTYSVDFFNPIEAHLPNLGEYTYRMENNATPEDGVLTVTVLENSNQRIRFNVSGTIMKKEGGVENWTDVKMVPVDAEFSFDRAYYKETTSNAVFLAGAKCDCQKL